MVAYKISFSCKHSLLNYKWCTNNFHRLDHTAEVLENYRKIQENILYDRLLHDGRDKKAYLRKEDTKVNNLIDNFESKFLNYGYFDNTEAVGV